MPTGNAKNMAKVIAKAWTDEKYKAQLLKNPSKVLKAEGVKTPKGAKIQVHENTKKAFHLVLPQKPTQALGDDAVNQRAGAHGVHMLYTCSS